MQKIADGLSDFLGLKILLTSSSDFKNTYTIVSPTGLCLGQFSLFQMSPGNILIGSCSMVFGPYSGDFDVISDQVLKLCEQDG